MKSMGCTSILLVLFRSAQLGCTLYLLASLLSHCLFRRASCVEGQPRCDVASLGETAEERATTTMSECTGKYKLATSENFEEFMKVLGVGLLTRKLGNKTSPTVTITKEGDEYNFRQDSIKTSEFKFKVDVPFEEITADGRKVISTMTQVAPNKMKHEMKGTDGGKDSVCVREFFADKLIAVCHCEGVETTRVYHAVP